MRHSAFVALLALVLTACTGGSIAPTTGTLQVVVAGVAAGTAADVTVTGPGGYSQAVTQTTTLNNLVPGSYTVTPHAFTRNLESYLADGAAQSAAVTAGGNATVTVGFTLNPTRIVSASVDPASPASLVADSVGGVVNVAFSYVTNHAGGVLIFARPFTGNALSPGYAASPSPTYTAAAGNGTGYFQFSAPVTVDKVRFQILDTTQSTVLYEGFLPVNYQFSTSGTRITSASFSPVSPATLTFGQNVTVNFTYVTDQPAGVRIFPRPSTGGNPTSNYGASGSPLYPTGSGNGSGSFTISSGAVTVDHVRFEIYDATNTTLLYEGFVPTNFKFQ